MKTIQVTKGQIIQRKGERNTKVYKVISGLLRSYVIDEKGKEHIFMFAPENWNIADSEVPEEPCELYIDALENSEVLVLDKDPSKDGIEIGQLLKRILMMQKRIISLMSYTAYERYEQFITTYPNIVQRVPQRMIASFLGVTPEALSKVKSEHRKKLNS